MGVEPRSTRLRRRWPGALGRLAGVLGALLTAFFLGGHFRGARLAAPPNAAATSEVHELEHSLDELESHLTQGEAWVLHQSELRRRHERVSALACTAATAQASDMARIVAEKRKRARRAASTDDDADEAAP